MRHDETLNDITVPSLFLRTIRDVVWLQTKEAVHERNFPKAFLDD